MTYCTTFIMSIFEDLFGVSKDPRVQNWFLVSSSWYSVAVAIIYLSIVLVIGPKLMEKRKPYELKHILLWYNGFQVVVSMYIFYESVIAGWLTDFSWICQPIDYSTSPRAVRTARLLHWYYLSRYTELFDTLFFVLRKKNNQITLLHVFHHGVMPFFAWNSLKAGAGGSTTFPVFWNSLIHIFMYMYYLLAGMGPEVHKYLWWKKYITTGQLVQFVIVLIHNITILLSSTTCNIPIVISAVHIFSSVSFFILFYLYYQSEYKKKTHEKTL